MKTAALKRRIIRFNHYRPYPNAATQRQLLHRFLDLLLMAASGMGMAAMLLLLLTLL